MTTTTTTTITYDLLKAAEPGAYNSAASAVQSVIDAFEQAAADLNVNVYQQVEYIWSGPAASAAVSSIGSTVADYQATLDYLNRFMGLLRSAYEGIADAQAYLSAAETIATNNGWTIGDDGEAAPQTPANLHGRVAVDAAWQSMDSNPEYAEMQQLITQGLKTAQAVNDQISVAMADSEQYGKGANWQKDAAGAQSCATKLESTLESTDEIPAGGTDSADVLAWWTALGEANPSLQTQLIKDQPTVIGPLNGIPSPARDQANRIVLANTIQSDQQSVTSLTAQQQQIENEMAQLKAQGNASVSPNRSGITATNQMLVLENQLGSVNRNLSSTQTQLAAMTSLQSQLRQGGKPTVFDNNPAVMPSMYLLDFDTNNAGHAIVACGNPDTAKNVCVYVPGMNTSSNDPHFQFDVQHTQNMTLEADSDTRSDSTSTILWLGYNSPQLDSNGNPSPAVLSEGDAEAAIPDLTSFLGTMHTVNQNISNLTLLGHSYGSLVVGLTAQQSHLPVDNIVLVGSPGVRALNASDLNIDPSHVWTGRAPADPVAGSGWFGIAPTDREFGANQFTVNADNGGPPLYEHGDYFDSQHNANNDKGESSLRNIGYIIAGQTSRVQSVHPVEAGPYEPPY